MVLGAACELLAAYFVYGSIRNDKWYQNKEFVKFLSLRKKINGVTGRSDPLQGLSFTQSINMADGKLTLRKQLVYQINYSRQILTLLSERETKEFWHILTTNELTESDEEQMIKILWKALRWFSEMRLFPTVPKGEAYTDRKLVWSVIRERFLRPLTCFELLEQVFEKSQCQRSRGLVQILRSVQGKIGGNNLQSLISKAGRLIEKELYATKSFAFLYPVDRQSIICVLPLFPYDEISYVKLSIAEQRNFVRLYEIVHEQYLDVKTTKMKDYIQKIEVEKRTDFSVLDVFHSIWAKDLVNDIRERFNIPSTSSDVPTIYKYN